MQKVKKFSILMLSLLLFLLLTGCEAAKEAATEAPSGAESIAPATTAPVETVVAITEPATTVPESAAPATTAPPVTEAAATEVVASASTTATQRPPFLLPDPDQVAVYVGNDLFTMVPFAQETMVPVAQTNGNINEITLTGEEVYMSYSTCDNQQCVHQDAITEDNYETRILFQFIICLPNQVTIEFVPGGE